MEPTYQIGQKLETSSFGPVIVADIFISPTTKRVAYLVVTAAAEQYLARGEDLSAD